MERTVSDDDLKAAGDAFARAYCNRREAKATHDAAVKRHEAAVVALRRAETALDGRAKSGATSMSSEVRAYGVSLAKVRMSEDDLTAAKDNLKETSAAEDAAREMLAGLYRIRATATPPEM